AITTDSTSSLYQSCSAESETFFFQAEDGIRDLTVTGVQTCALPISFTLMFGSNSSFSLFTEHNNSPTLRVFRCTTCLGIISVLPSQVLLGSASQVILTG